MKSRMKIKLFFAMAMAVGLLICVVGFSAFAAAPYKNPDAIPGFATHSETITAEDGTETEISWSEISFEFGVFDYSEKVVGSDSYQVWSSSENEPEPPQSYLTNGYTVNIDDLCLPEYSWEMDDEGNFIIFRGYGLSDASGNVTDGAITTLTEGNYGCTLAPVFTPATDEEREEIEKEIAEAEKEEAERQANGVAGYVVEWDEDGEHFTYTQYCLLSEIKIVKTPLSGDALANALAKAGVDSKNKVAYDIKLYADWDDDCQYPLFVRSGKSISVTLPKPDVEGAEVFEIVHIKDDGSIEKLPATVDGNNLNFSITSCSPFVPSGGPAPGSGDSTSSDDTTTVAATTTTTAASSDTNKGSTNSPSTGEGSYVPVVVLFILSVLAAGGVFGLNIIKKKSTAETVEK